MKQISIIEKLKATNTTKTLPVPKTGAVVQASVDNQYKVMVDGVELTSKNAKFTRNKGKIVVEQDGEVVIELDYGPEYEVVPAELQVTEDVWAGLIPEATEAGIVAVPGLLWGGLGAAGAAGAAAASGVVGGGGDTGTTTDTTPPAAPTVSAADPDANGKINASGTAEPGSTVAVTWPDGSTSSTTADSVGNWSIESPNVQTTGNVKATATDTDGNTGSATTIAYTDTTAPLAPTINAADPDADGKINASGTAEPGSIVNVTWPGGSTSTVTTGTDGNWSVESPNIQSNGTVSATATDAAGNTGTATTIAYTDTTAPTINSMTITSAAGIQNNTLNAGDVVSVTVNMSEPTTIIGTPLLGLNINGTTVQANYTTGSGTDSLIFTYTVQAGLNDPNGISINADSLTLNGGTLTDNAGNNAVLAHAAVGDNANYMVDTTVPIITIHPISGGELTKPEHDALGTTPLTISGITNDVENGQNVTITLNGRIYNTSITGNAWQYAIPNADTLALNNGNTYTAAAYTTDAAGNVSNLSTGTLKINIAPPDIPTIIQLITNDTTPALTGHAEKTLDNGATYIKLAAGDNLSVSIDGSVTYTLTVGSTSSPAGLTYNITSGNWQLDMAGATPLAEGSHEVSVSATAAGITKSDISTHELNINTAAVTVAMDNITSDDLINAGERAGTVIISGTTGNVETDRLVTVTLADKSTVTTNVLTDGSWSTSIAGSTFGADGSKSIKADVTNTAGTAATQASRTVIVDTIAPTISIAADDSALKIGDTAHLTFTLSEAATDFTATDIVVTGGTMSNFTGSGSTYTADFTPTPGSTTGATVDVAAATFKDAAGNNNTAATQLTMSIDTAAPTISIAATLEGDNIVNATEDNDVVVSGTTTAIENGRIVTVTLSDGTTTVTKTATVSGNAWALSGADVADISTWANGNISITANVSDLAGNPAPEATKTIVLDNEAPTISIAATLEGDNIVNATEDNDVVVSGTTTGIENGRIVAVTLSDGTTTVTKTATVSGNTWALTGADVADISTWANGNISITANVSDLAGNPAPEATKTIVLYNEAPTVTIDAADTDGDGLPTISGTTEVGSTVILTLPDGTTKVTTTADSSGHYSVELTSLPSPLLGTYTAVATAIAGSTGLPATSIETDLSSPLLGGSGAGDLRVNTTISGSQIAPKNVGLVDGTFVTVWASVGQDGSGAGVYGQRFDAHGGKIGGEFLVNTYTSGAQGVYTSGNWASDLDVIALKGGGFQVAWGDAGYDGSGWGIYGQNYDANGVRTGLQYVINTTTNDWQDVPQGAGLVDGGSVVVWASANQDGPGYGVYGQRYNADGTVNGGEFRVNVTTAGNQGARPNAEEENVSVTALTGGGFVVTWASDTGGVGWDNWARIFKADGTALTAEFRVNTYTTNDQWLPQVTNLVDGGFLVTWVSLGQDGSGSGLYGQRFTASGAQVGGEFRLNTTPPGHQAGWINGDDQRYHDAIGLENGGWVAAWASEQSEIIGDIYYQVYDASGNKVGGETRVNSVTASYQYHVSLASAGYGGFVISWDSWAEDGSEWSVQQKIYEADGLERMVDPSRDILTNTTITGHQIAPKSAALADGGHIETWASDQGGTWDVWGQRYDANGAKVGIEFRANTTTTGSQGYYAISTGIPLLDVIGLKGGGYIITWSSDTGDTSGWGVYAQRYDAAGVAQSGEFKVNSYVANNQWAPQGAELTDGGFVIVWSSQGQDGAGMGVYGRRYNPDGSTNGSEFAVNTATTGDQGSRVDYWEEGLSVAGLKGGGFAVTWFTTSGVNSYDVNARIFKADGTPLTVEFTVNSTTAGAQWLPQVTELDSGSFVITWAVYDQGGDAWYGLYGQIYNATGDKIGTEFRINTTLTGHQGGAVEEQDDRLHDVVGLASGGFVAVWTSEGQDGTYSTTYMQLFDALGNRVGGETRVANGNGDRQRHVTVNELTDGGYVVAWDSYYQDATNSWGIYHKTFNADGSERTGETWHAGVGAVAVAPDLAAAVRDGNTQMGGAAVTVTNFHTGDVLGFTTQNGINGSYDGNGHLTLTGSASLAQYQAALRSVTFNNTSGTPDLTARDFTFTLTDLAGNTAAPVHADLSLYNTYASTVVADTSAPLLGSSDVGDTRVNTNTYYSQWLPRSAGLDDGGYITVWTSDITGTWDVYGQHFDAHGVKIGEQFLVNSTTADTQGYIGTNIGTGNLDVAGSANGGFVVTWGSYQGGNWEVRAQFYDAQGIKTGAEIAVNTYTAGGQLIPQAAATADGGYVIVWDSTSGQDGSGPGVYGQRFDATGAKLGGEFRVNVTTAGSQGYREWGADTYEENISVTGLTGGGFAVTWFSDTGGDGFDVWGRIYKADGTALTGEFVVNRTMTNNQWLPQITHLGDGGFLATWVSWGNATDPSNGGLYGQRFTATGVPVGAEFLINTTIINGQGGYTTSEGTAMDERMHDVTGLAGGGWVATWMSDYQDGSYQGMYMQVYDATGKKVGGETRVNTVTADRQRHVTVTDLADGGFVVSWDSCNQEGYTAGYWGTYQKMYEANGMERLVNVAGDVLVNTTTTGTQYAPTIGTLADGGHLVTWTDLSGLDGSGYGVYGQRYDINGNKTGGQFQVNTATVGQQGAVDNGSLMGTNQSIIGLSNGRYVVIYGSFQSPADTARDIYAKIYNADGTVNKAEFRINSTVANDQIYPQGAATSDGGFVITWAGYNQTYDGVTDADYGVYAQRYNAAGVTQGSEFRVNTTTAGDQGSRALTTGWEEGLGVAALGGDGFVVTWFGSQSGRGQVYTQQYNNAGVKVGGEVTVNDVDNGQWQWQPQVTNLADGGYLVVWAAYGRTPDTGGYGIWGQRYDATGAKVGNNFMLSSPSPKDQGGNAEGYDDRLHDVVGLAGGGWVASWTWYEAPGPNGVGYDALQWAEIYYQIYDAAGNKVGAEMRANTNTTDPQRHNEVTALKDGGFVVTWDSYAQNGSGWDVYKQTFNADGSVRGSDAWHHGGTAVTVAPKLETGVADGLTQMNGATVTVANFHSGDVLGFTDQNGIIGSYDNNGHLTLSGSATLAQYQVALRCVTFNNTSGTPDLTERVIDFTLTDASNNTSSSVGTTVHLYDTALYLAGTTGAETLTGGAGADTLIGKGGADTLVAGAGDDRIIISDNIFTSFDGGEGTDALVLNDTGISLDLTNPAIKAKVHGIEQIHLGDNSTNGVTTSTTANTLRLNLADVLDIAGGTLRVDGAAGDKVNLSNYGGSWTDTNVTQQIADKTYKIYTNSGSATAKLLVDTSITTTIDTANINGTHTMNLGDFNLTEMSDSLSAVRINSTSGADGVLKLNGVAVTIGQIVTAADIIAGKLVWVETTAVTTAAKNFNINYNGYDTSGTISPEASTLTLTRAAAAGISSVSGSWFNQTDTTYASNQTWQHVIDAINNGGHSAVVNNANEWTTATAAATDTVQVEIGLRQNPAALGNAYGWQWYDGTRLNTSLTPWSASEPNGGGGANNGGGEKQGAIINTSLNDLPANHWLGTRSLTEYEQNEFTYVGFNNADTLNFSGVTNRTVMVNGKGGADTITGGGGNDTISVPDKAFVSVNGGNGFDVLEFTATEAVNGATLATKVFNIEEIKLGEGNQQLTLTNTEVNAMTPWSNHTLYVSGTSGDQLGINVGIGASSWHLAGTAGGLNNYVWYDAGNAATSTRLLVDTTVQVVGHDSTLLTTTVINNFSDNVGTVQGDLGSMVRYLRIYHTDATSVIALTGLKVSAGGVEVAAGIRSTIGADSSFASNVYNSVEALTDENIGGTWNNLQGVNSNLAYSNTGTKPYIEIDLGALYAVDSLTLWGRDGFSNESNNLRVYAGANAFGAATYSTLAADSTVRHHDINTVNATLNGTGTSIVGLAATNTDDTTPILNGTLSQAIGGADVVQIFDGASFLGNATVTGTTWTYALGTAIPLAAGSTHSYTARVGDASSNVGTLSSAFTLTVSSPAERLTNGDITGSAAGWETNGNVGYDNNQFVFNSSNATPNGNVYQTITGLTVGQSYTLQYQLAEYGNAGSHQLSTHVQNGDVWNGGAQLTMQVITKTTTAAENYSTSFVAQSGTATVVFNNNSGDTNATDLVLNKASVMLISDASHTTFTPLLLDLNGDGVRTTDAAHGVLFDAGNTGMIGRTAWADVGDGLLVRDLNGNGAIDHGGELFGEGTLLPNGEQAANGFAALAQFDANQDGTIDGQDAIFKELLAWRDANHDGVSQTDELHSLAGLGVASLNLAAKPGQTVENGNLHGLVSSYTMTDGTIHDLTDVWFQQGAQGSLTTNEAGVTTLHLVTEGQSLDLITVDTARLHGVDRIDLAGADANLLKLSLRDVLEIGDLDSCTADKGWTGIAGVQGRYQLVVDGDGKDKVVIGGGGFVSVGTATCNGIQYEVYNSVTDSAQLLINHQVVMG